MGILIMRIYMVVEIEAKAIDFAQMTLKVSY